MKIPKFVLQCRKRRCQKVFYESWEDFLSHIINSMPRINLYKRIKILKLAFYIEVSVWNFIPYYWMNNRLNQRLYII